MDMQEIDRLCDEFERRLRAGEKLIVEGFAREVGANECDELIAELRRIEEELNELPVTISSPGMSTGGEATSFPASVRYFGDYEILDEIARGGMGVVFKARQVSLNRVVALKMILAGMLAGEDAVKRFKLEAEAAAQLDHSGIVPIFEIGEHDGQHYFSMGYIEGESLAERLREGPLPTKTSAELMVKICDAVAYAHDKGVIHRDLKPGNVLIDSAGTPKVSDFGLAKRVDSDSDLTRTGEAIGTPAYMPPEQASGKIDEIGPPSDVYALGAILYAMLIGRPPFQAATPVETLRQVIDQEPVSPRTVNPQVPRDLETICLKCLRKNPGKRFAGAEELSRELRRFIAGEPIDRFLRSIEFSDEYNFRVDFRVKPRAKTSRWYASTDWYAMK